MQPRGPIWWHYIKRAVAMYSYSTCLNPIDIKVKLNIYAIVLQGVGAAHHVSSTPIYVILANAQLDDERLDGRGWNQRKTNGGCCIVVGFSVALTRTTRIAKLCNGKTRHCWPFAKATFLV